MLKLSFPTRKLKGSLIKITDKYKNFENKTLQAYGVTNKEGIVITGKNISDDTSNYTVITGKTFVYNPYRINVGSIGLTDDDFKGIVSPAYVAFKVKDDILPEFLLLYLKSSLGINLIKWYGDRGGVRSALRFNDLEKIDFPDLSYEQQKEALKNINKFIKIQNTLNQEMENQVTYISKFRQSILQDAIQGKLVPQDPTDEPASELLKKIRAEKEQLIKEGKLKKEKINHNNINQIPFELPNTWQWCKFYEIANIASNLVSPDKYLDFPHIAPNNIEKGNGKLLQYNSVRIDSVISFNHYFYAGQILYSKIRPNLSKVVIVDFDGLCSADMYPINSFIDTNYLKLYMLSKTFLSYSTKNDTRVAMPKINKEELINIPVPIPPKEEQERIVEKVNELMQLCDMLENENSNAQKFSSELLQSIMQKYFTPEV